ncbi:GNAT superfamily N-acetyltransferase [Lewinella marina]|uniref:GNAT family N-acetyltransferase n=1 Tax=Neolewinella marina TaxID=438751 RepID=A0A2G0CAS2_9BACT|nr:GNAT family N-acetyltransferase [Neolewinella marina]NJB87178.1 GNAT superfamily N-acetyltransferase [Neolewinella marina]PHK97060.1 GNAT family N-acetyltransferase [Neolewinella marina]
MKLLRTTPDHPEYRRLIPALDRELAITDGEDHAFYDQFNKSDDIHHVVLLLEGDRALACGALKAFHGATAEVKRMYTASEVRGRGLAGRILEELERWAAELGYTRLILETGIRQTPAISLYTRHGYQRMAENYGPYAGITESVCMEKEVG